MTIFRTIVLVLHCLLVGKIEAGWILDAMQVAENTIKTTSGEIAEWVKEEGKLDRLCSGMIPTKKGDLTFGEKLEIETQFLLGKRSVEPIVGSVVRCRLGPELDMWDHSGIYVGNNRIIHRDGDGRILEVSPEQFLARLDGNNSATTIFVVCDVEGRPMGKPVYAERARQLLVSGITGYDLLNKNCHQFCQWCIGNHVEDSSVPKKFTFTELREDLARQHYDMEQASFATRVFPTQLLIWYTTNEEVKLRIANRR